MGIEFSEQEKLFRLQTKTSTYQIRIDETGILRHLYYGLSVGAMDMGYLSSYQEQSLSGDIREPHERKHDPDFLPQEFTGAGIGDYRISGIALTAGDGSKSVDFRYSGHKISPGKYNIPGLPSVRGKPDEFFSLEITMADVISGLELKLLYGVMAEYDIITRTAILTNTGNTGMKLEKFASVCLDMFNTKLDLLHFPGRHCMERQLERVPLDHAIHTISSRRGMSSHQQNPFLIVCPPKTDDDQGDCYGMMLMYSGNHKSQIEVDQRGNTRIVMGIHDENFNWNLAPGESFYAPEVIMSYSGSGLNSLSYNYHRLIRENVCPEKFSKQRRPILINNWEATYFDFNTEKILKLAREAKDLGIEMFVLDDGWFGNRNDDFAGLGDWYPNLEKLPNGISGLSKKITDLGMAFGLWLEPEMVNELSALYTAHPNWALQDPGRKPTLSRNQLVLDMANRKVQDHLYQSIATILDNANIAYIKWDFNRALANVYSNVPGANQGETAHRFVLGTYALLERLTQAYPEVMFETCAGGGGRFDAGMLYYSPQIWCSDNTDPIARLNIQKGTSYGYPVSTMGSHVSASPNHQTGRTTTLKTRGIVAMSGTFGYELDLSKCSRPEKDEIKSQISDFKKYYWLIQKGVYYRLSNSSFNDSFEAWSFVSEDKSEALVNLVMKDVHANGGLPSVLLKGLQADAWYQVEGTAKKYTGAALMHGGYTFPAYKGDYPCEQLHLMKL